MNKYLLAALYVMAGCVVTMPSGTRGETVPVGTNSYRLLISSAQKIITVVVEKKSVEELTFDMFASQNLTATSNLVTDHFSYSLIELSGFNLPEVTANLIRAPGKSGLYTA